MKSVYIYPAQLHAASEPTEIKTILGSCVAVALYCPIKKIGGLNHYLLAENDANKDNTLRYGKIAIHKLYDEVIALGGDPKQIQAKIYGGAAVLENNTLGSAIGVRNIEIARIELEKLKVPIIDENVGGKKGRRISLNTETFAINHELMGSSEEAISLSGIVIPKLATKIKVMIVDDSITVRQIFAKILGSDPRIEIVGIAADAYEARQLLIEKKPTVIFLDIEMPRMNGIQFLEKIMQYAPTPTIMVSSLGANEEAAHRCLELGAIEFVNKPSQFDPSILKHLAASLIEKAIAAASIPLTKIAPELKSRTISKAISSTPRAKVGTFDFRSQVILIGGNAGAQKNISEFLTTLPPDTPPIAISISSLTPFLRPFLEKLKNETELTLHIVNNGDILMRGHVYFAPAEQHFELEKTPTGTFKAKLSNGLPVCGQIPSSAQLFNSVNKACNQNLQGITGILFSGFGNDGADALLAMRDNGALTIVTNPKNTSFAYLSDNAISIGAACEVATPGDMAAIIMQLRNKLV